MDSITDEGVRNIFANRCAFHSGGMDESVGWMSQLTGAKGIEAG